LDNKIVKSDTIIPDSDLSIKEATKIFKGEIVISSLEFYILL